MIIHCRVCSPKRYIYYPVLPLFIAALLLLSPLTASTQPAVTIAQLLANVGNIKGLFGHLGRDGQGSDGLGRIRGGAAGGGARALMLINPYPWSAPLEEVRLKKK